MLGAGKCGISVGWVEVLGGCLGIGGVPYREPQNVGCVFIAHRAAKNGAQ